jgi:hypothetical protein
MTGTIPQMSMKSWMKKSGKWYSTFLHIFDAKKLGVDDIHFLFNFTIYENSIREAIDVS